MYKFLLCWRYLRTRYLALACVISVMLGVATLIVVNSVMSGFSTKLKERLHGILSDIVIETAYFEGFPGPDELMERIKNDPVAGPKVEAMTPIMEVFAMLQFRYHGEMMTRPVRLFGIDAATRARVGGFAEHLVLQKSSPSPSFALSPQARARSEAVNQPRQQMQLNFIPLDTGPGDPPPPDPPPSRLKEPVGVILGRAIAAYRMPGKNPGEPAEEKILLEPGDNVILTTVSGEKLAPVFDRFAVCDYFQSELSEYDANYVFVPLEHLQKLRTMEDRVSSLQIKLRDYADAKEVKDRLELLFPSSVFHVATWEDKQGPLLGAIAVEKGILNVLLFLIICVAGFGILAIFAMIVVEKTRDIGILKALGASNGGVMKIFLGYGLLLGVVGAGLGTLLGWNFTLHINEIEKVLGRVTGQDIFPRDIYYFNEIPTDIQPLSVLLVNVGALIIAVVFSILPALRAAMLHPVRALRYE